MLTCYVGMYFPSIYVSEDLLNYKTWIVELWLGEKDIGKVIWQ